MEPQVFAVAAKHTFDVETRLLIRDQFDKFILLTPSVRGDPVGDGGRTGIIGGDRIGDIAGKLIKQLPQVPHTQPDIRALIE